MTELYDAFFAPVHDAMVESKGDRETLRAEKVVSAFLKAIPEADYFLIHRDVMVKMNGAMLAAQAYIRLQKEELLRLAIDGAEVNVGLLGEMEPLQ
ncbi:hypothetical protein Xaut_3626 [Xanthobacter versatilis]|uniref:Uncharacterized protein n=1 Tax=Xanthobacter autotrophicus (strain ATCC BAA-1158 / Py2) TaxID=78245 RepID=A7ILG1_XANP2|nr:hypothetical protein Xaut_3626 [Xanthobacter autotrophicus Py2]